MLIEHAPRRYQGVQSLMYVGDDGVPTPPSTGTLVLAAAALCGVWWLLRRRRRKA